MSKLYYDVNQTLSYNALFNFVVGVRGCGKTVGCKMWAGDEFIKNRKGFVYVRRYEEDLNSALLNFWGVLKRIDKKYEGFTVVGNKFYYNDIQCGIGVALSTASRYKSSDFDFMDKVIFDEFQCEGSQRYIKGMNEVKIFLNLYESVNRERDIKAFFLGNPVTDTNPYYLYWGVGLPYNGKNIQRFKKHIVVHNVTTTEFKDYKQATKFGELIKDTDYGNYSIEGINLNDNTRFIKKRPANCRIFFTAMLYNTSYGVWLSLDDYKFYISKKYDPSYKVVYSFDVDSHTENTLIFKRFQRSGHISQLVDSFKTGNLYFEDITIKNMFFEKLKNLCF